MCINSTTSLISFIIGELSGLILFTYATTKIKKYFGLFIMFYSLIQLFEYNIYKNIYAELNSKLLLFNLGCQGFIFFMLMNNVCSVNKLYIYISFIIMIIITIIIFKKKMLYITLNDCIQWNFMDDCIVEFITIMMYSIIFFWSFTNICDNETKKIIHKLAYFYIITLLLSYFILNTKNNPSFWCMSSALISPIILFV
jgi:hypothetical protein